MLSPSNSFGWSFEKQPLFSDFWTFQELCHVSWLHGTFFEFGLSLLSNSRELVVTHPSLLLSLTRRTVSPWLNPSSALQLDTLSIKSKFYQQLAVSIYENPRLLFLSFQTSVNFLCIKWEKRIVNTIERLSDSCASICTWNFCLQVYSACKLNTQRLCTGASRALRGKVLFSSRSHLYGLWGRPSPDRNGRLGTKVALHPLMFLSPWFGTTLGLLSQDVLAKTYKFTTASVQQMCHKFFFFSK